MRTAPHNEFTAIDLRATGSPRPRLRVSADGRGVVGHAGARLLADLAEVMGLESAFVDALAPTRRRLGGHAPGRVASISR
jgi:hypothetical protein